MRRHFGKILGRWRPRFGLRGLFLLLTVVCVGLGSGVSRWRREVAAIREIHTRGYPDFVARDLWGVEREISDHSDLRPWETVVRTDHTCVEIERLDAVLSGLPNTRNIGFERPKTAADYRKLIAVQQKYPQVDIKWELCSYMPHPAWFRGPRNGEPGEMTDFQAAELEWYRLKGWNTEFMQLHKWKVPTE